MRGLQVAYKEFISNAGGESPTLSADNESMQATRVLDVAWSDLDTAIAQILGYPTRVAGPPVTISRYLPEYDPKRPFLIATKISSIKGVGPRGIENIDVSGVSGEDSGAAKRLAKYEKARLTVEYEFPSYNVLSDADATTEVMRYVIEEAQPSAEFLNVPVVGASAGQLVWSEGDNTCEVFPGNVAYIIGTIDYK